MAHENRTLDAMLTGSPDRIYPADYTLKEWLLLRAGWDRELDVEAWHRAQYSALGPSLPRGVYSDKFGDRRWIGTGELYKELPA